MFCTKLFSRLATFRTWSRRAQIFAIILVVLGTSLPATLLHPHGAHAATIGPNNPTASIGSGTGTGWIYPGNVFANDAQYANVTLAGGGTSMNLNVTGFGFSLPAGSTINGVTVDVEKYATPVNKATIEDSSVQLLKAGTAAGTTQATTTAWPSSDSYVTYGGTSNLWGTTLAVTDVNDSNFGVALSVKNVKSGAGASNTAYVDHVRMTVTYTPPPYSVNQSSYRFFNNVDGTGGGSSTFAIAWGGTGTEEGKSVVQTSDGGYAVAGYETSFGGGSDDAFIAKYNASGALSWNRVWGGSGADDAYSLVQTSDGGYAVTGETLSYGDTTNGDMFLAKFDSSGTLSWSRTWGGSTGADYGQTVVQTSDGGYAVAGTTASYGAGADDVFLARYDSSGTLSWSRTWGGTNYEEDYSLALTSDGGFIVLCNTGGFGAGSEMPVLIKYDSSGTLTWNSTWTSGYSDYGESVVQTSDGGYAIGGYTNGLGAGSNDAFIAKFSSTGVLSWTRTWGGTGSDDGFALTQTSDGGLALTGYAGSFGAGYGDVFLAKYDGSGNLLWNRTWGGTNYDYAQAIVQTASDGGYAITGYTQSYGAGGYDMFLLRYDSTGSLANCSSPTCQSPTATSSAQTATSSSPAATTSSPTVTTSSPTVTNSSPTATSTTIVAPSSSPIDVGSPLAAQNTAASSGGDGQPFRLRLDIGITNSDLSANGQAFKLQYAPMATSCDTGFTNTPASAYNDVTDTSTVQYYDNPNANNGAPLTANVNDPTDGSQTIALETYQEKGTTTFTDPTAITAGEDGMWDFALTTSGTAAGQHYCLRIVKNDGTTLTTYTTIPEIITPPATLNQASYRFFNNQDATPGGGTLSFSSDTQYATGNNPYQVAIADVNGDGKPDIVTANGYNPGTVSVLPGTGSGTFGTKTDYATGSYPYAVAVADVNGDGKPDIVTANNNLPGSVSVLLNSGSGTFPTHTEYTTGNYPTSVAIADLNGDSKPDLVVATGYDGTIAVLLNTGSGAFGTSTPSTGTGNPQAVAVADVNGDGKPDIVATSDYGSPSAVSVFLNSGSGTFSSHTDYNVGTFSYAVAIADVNGDGKPDIVATDNTSPGTVSVLLNKGSGTFGTDTDYPTDDYPQGVALADVNGDSKLDIIASTANSPGVISVLLGTGSGTFGTKTDFTVGSSSDSVAAADLNGDNKPDIVAGDNTNPGTASVLLNTTSAAAIDVSTPLAAQNTAATAPGDGQPFRMRLNIGVSASSIAASSQSLKLQYALRSTSCDTSFAQTTGASYADVTSTSTVRYYDNTVATNGMTMATDANDPTDGTNTLVRQAYQESGTTTFTNPNAVPAGQDGMWDFALTTNGTTGGQHYCLRVVTSTGATLSSYTVIPEIMLAGATDAAPNTPTSLVQEKTDNTVLSTGAWVSATSIKFTASSTDPDASDTLQLCVEAQPLGTNFTNTETACGTGVAYSGTAVTPTVTLTGLNDATQYHWQARIKDSGGLYSVWVSYGGNAETAQDFGTDTTPPSGGIVYDGTSAGTDASFNDGSLSSLSANWSGVSSNVSGLAGYEYSIGTSAGATDVKGWTSTGTTPSVTASGLTLHTSNKYFVNVRTTDNAGNVSSIISSDGQFVAPSVSFSVSPSTITFANLKASNSYTDTKTTTLTTSTNAYGGYVVRNLMTDLLRSGSNKTIPDFNGGTYAAPDSWQPGDIGFGYTSSDTLVQGVNKFQSATCPGGSALAAPGCYAPFSHTSPGDIVADNTNNVTGTPITNEQFTITYRITASSTQAATTYNASAVYSITPMY